MLRKSGRRLAAYSTILVFAVGGLVAWIGHLQLIRSVQREALARVEDANNVAERLLGEELARLDPRPQAAGWPSYAPCLPSPLIEESGAVDPASPPPEILRTLVAQAAQGAAVARGFVRLPERGLSLAAVVVEGDVYRAVLRPLRGENCLPDFIRGVVFGETMADEARPTVTLFEGETRIATNVTLTDGQRAVGTRVSEEVARRVLTEGRNWNDRAFVVNRMVLTSYHPLRSPEGRVIGMIYVGLDEAPYVARGRRASFVFLGVILGFTLVVASIGWIVGKRLVRPLDRLVVAARTLAQGEHDHIEPPSGSTLEIERLTRSFNEMAEQVLARTRALEASQRETQAALDSYMEVLGFVAHEMKSPVNGALTSLGLIRDGYVGIPPEEMRKPLGAIGRHLAYAQEIARSFNVLSHTESAGFHVDAQRLGSLCDELLTPLAEDFADEAREREMTIAVEGDASGVWIDPGLLRIALSNLLGNALKYGRQGSRIRVGAEDTEQGRVRLSVWNEGVGIPEARYPDLFRKFSRVKDPAFRRVRGTGLGLYFVRRIAEEHGGGVSVDGVYGEWIAFRLDLPARPPNAPDGADAR